MWEFQFPGMSATIPGSSPGTGMTLVWRDDFDLILIGTRTEAIVGNKVISPRAHLLQGQVSRNALKARISNLSLPCSGCVEPYFTTALTSCSMVVRPGISVHRMGSS